MSELNDKLSARVLALERALILGTSSGGKTGKNHHTYNYEDENEHEGLLRSRLAVAVTYELYSACWHWVPSDVYYKKWNLEDRQLFLKAPSIHCLCKSMLMEYLPSKYVLCIVQYTASLDTKAISSAIRQHVFTEEQKKNLTKLSIQMASSDDNAKVTGYIHNAVTPIGMTCQADIPILLSSSLLLLDEIGGRMYVGGGHPFCKLSVSITEFVQKVPNVHIANISTTRTSYEDLQDD